MCFPFFRKWAENVEKITKEQKEIRKMQEENKKKLEAFLVETNCIIKLIEELNNKTKQN